MSNFTGGYATNTRLRVGRSVANMPVYRGPLKPASEATLAARASEARTLSQPVCECGLLKPLSGVCC